jgi:hypothetical protein
MAPGAREAIHQMALHERNMDHKEFFPQALEPQYEVGLYQALH